MPRPCIKRRIRGRPNSYYFKPAGIRIIELEETTLNMPEFEAIRFVDFKNIEQSKAAKQMQVSQPTLSRILTSARKKISDAIINGKAIKIQGGDYKMVQPTRKGAGRRAGRGRMGGFAAGPGGDCICPKCGATTTHQIGIPCNKQKCPKCQSLMTRR